MFGKQIINGNKPLIWPIPNELNWKSGEFKVGNSIGISCDECFKSELQLFALQLEAEGVRAEAVCCGGDIRLEKCEDERINNEGYLLDIDSDGITLKARTASGMFYGMQSLIQLIENSYGRCIPGVSIVDSPFKPVRGVHIYLPPRDKFTWFKRYVDFLAKYRYNTMYIEIGAAMEFDSHPEINRTWEAFCEEMMAYPGGPDGSGMQCSIGHPKDSVHIENGGRSYLKKAEITELIEYVRKRHIEIIPEVQSLAHSYWLLMPHREMAERADDPYPDTYCPSNPAVYDILFDCMQEVVDLFKPGTIHIGHDEFYTIGLCEKCREKTGHDILAGDILKLYEWLKERNIRLAMWCDKLFEYTSQAGDGFQYGGRERLNFNSKTRKNEVMKATYRAADMLPDDIIIMDWYHSIDPERESGSQDYFYRRGYDVVFGNFDDMRWRRYGVPNVEDRLRRPNVLGAECSLWHEVSDLGMALKDALVYMLDISNILWYEGYSLRKRYDFNRLIAQIYPLERDRMNAAPSNALEGKFEFIDISCKCNVPLKNVKDFSFITKTERLPNTVPFETSGGADGSNRLSCILAGHGMPDTVRNIMVNRHFRSLVFLHSYTADIGWIPMHACSYIGPEEDIVGSYIIHYEDGTFIAVPIEYSRTITYVDREFGAHWANPVYQHADVHEEIREGLISKKVAVRADCKVVFGYEWRNPYPERRIAEIGITHAADKKGGIVLFAVTGVI